MATEQAMCHQAAPFSDWIRKFHVCFLLHREYQGSLRCTDIHGS